MTSLPPPKPRWNKSATGKTTRPIGPNPFDLSNLPPLPGPDKLFVAPVKSFRKFGVVPEDSVRRAADELARRRVEALRLFEPMGMQQQFLDSNAPIRLLLGGNRVGKTLTGAIQCARIVCNMDDRYPKSGKFVIVGKDFDTIRNGTWRVLAGSGAFRVLQDPVTHEWRAVKPWDEWDKANKKLWKPAEPILPKRLIKDIKWLNKGLGIPKAIEMETGWEILVFSGESEPKAGFSADVAWLDEEIQNEMFVTELRQRLVDREGKLYWTATPENSTPALWGLYTLFDGGNKDINAWTLSAVDHPYHSAEARRIQMLDMSSENYRVKMLGEFRLGSAIIFPEWNWARLSVPKFQIPDTWTRYLSIDPGVNPCTIIFLAVPPTDDTVDPKHRGKIFVYDELIVEQSSAEKMADALKLKIQGQRFEQFVIDHHGSRITEAGSGENAEAQYRRAFEKRDIRSIRQGTNFFYGNDNPAVRVNAIREWIAGEDPILRVFENCSTLKHQMERYQYTRQHGLVTDKPLAKNNHTVDALGMLADMKPKYVPPTQRKKDHPIFKALAEKAKRRKGSTDTTFGPA